MKHLLPLQPHHPKNVLGLLKHLDPTLLKHQDIHPSPNLCIYLEFNSSVAPTQLVPRALSPRR